MASAEARPSRNRAGIPRNCTSAASHDTSVRLQFRMCVSRSCLPCSTALTSAEFYPTLPDKDCPDVFRHLLLRLCWLYPSPPSFPAFFHAQARASAVFQRTCSNQNRAPDPSFPMQILPFQTEISSVSIAPRLTLSLPHVLPFILLSSNALFS